MGLDVSEVNRSNFPLPTFGEKLKGLSTVVHDGPGFFVLRGLDPNDLSKLDNAILFVGVSSYLAERRGRQNQDGMMLSMLQYLLNIQFLVMMLMCLVLRQLTLRTSYRQMRLEPIFDQSTPT